MKKSYISLIFLSFILIVGLAFWQIWQLSESQKLKSEIEIQDIKSNLMATAISLRKMEVQDSTIRTNIERRFDVIDSLVSIDLMKFNKTFNWAIFDGNENKVNGLSSTNDLEALKNTDLNICISCLIMFNVFDEGEKSKPGFVISHSPSQMVEMRGLDKAQLSYLYILPEKVKKNYDIYIIPGLFFLGLGSLFIWLFYLSRKQSRLIRQKDEFVNHLSHQFQTPLSSIKLSANLLSKKYKKEELIQIIQTEGSRLENHIKTVLNWVKSDADRLQVNKEVIGITDIVEASMKQMNPIFLTNYTIVKFSPPKEELFIEADKNHLQLMLFNIWENAIKHNENAIELYINCKRQNGQITIINKDNGKGIKKLQNDFKYKGLGLQYVYKIMKMHNGNIGLSNNTSNGLSVTLNFPIYE